MEKNRSVKDGLLALYKEVEYPTVLALFLCGLCFYTLSFLDKEIVLMERLVILVVCYISSMKASSHWNRVQLMKITRQEKLVFVMIWLYATFAFAGMHFIGVQKIDIYFSLRYFILSAMWIGPTILWGYIALYDVSTKCIASRKKTCLSIREKGFVIGGILFACIVMLIAFNPAITTVDSEFCYSYAYDIIQGCPIFGDHPYFYVFLLSLLMRLNESISFMILAQNVFFALVCMKGINVLMQFGISKKNSIISFFIFGFGYNTIIQLSTLWKDIPFVISILWFTILIGEYVVKEPEEKISIQWYVEIIVAGIFVGFIRHGGLIPVCATMLILFLCSGEKRRLGSCIVIFFVVVFCVKIPLHDYLKVEDSGLSGLEFSALTNDIEYVYFNGGRLGEDALEIVLQATDHKPSEAQYNPWYSLNKYSNLSKYTWRHFLPIYIRTFINNPVLMAKGILIRCNYAWSIAKPRNGRETCVATLTESHRFEERLSLAIPKREENVLTKTISWIVHHVGMFPFIHIVYWRVGLFNLILVALFLLILTRGLRAALFAIPFLPILMNMLVLIMGCAWPNYRYFWPCMLCCSFLIPYGVWALSSVSLADSEKR